MIMLTLLLFLFALQVTTPGEMACLGTISDVPVPTDLYIAAVEQEGMLTLATQGRIVYLNGSRVGLLKVGETSRVVRPGEKVYDPITGAEMGIHYKDLGTIRIEAVDRESASARVVSSCSGLMKGDLVIPVTPRPAVKFIGDMSNILTPLPGNGLISSILMEKDKSETLGAGHICFIGLGKRDGVNPGDRFTIYRPVPPFNPQDMAMERTDVYSPYASLRELIERYRMNSKLGNRKVPMEVLGDYVVVEVGERSSAGKIVNSLREIRLGDYVVKR
jgi:hypothetical protein